MSWLSGSVMPGEPLALVRSPGMVVGLAVPLLPPLRSVFHQGDPPGDRWLAVGAALSQVMRNPQSKAGIRQFQNK